MHKFLRFKSILFCLTIQSLFFTQSVLTSPTIGLHFSPMISTQNGFLVLSLEISKSKEAFHFLAQELRFHSEKGWEEVLFSGAALDQEDGILLRPNSCQIRASAAFGEKKGLVRRFDCTHLNFVVSNPKSEQTQISTSLLGTLKAVPLPVSIPNISGEPVAISFLLPGSEKEEGVWGFHLNGIGKNNPIQIWNLKQNKWERFHTFETISDRTKYNIYLWKRSFSD